MQLLNMDSNKVAQVLNATLDPTQREMAEKHIKEFHKIIAFAPTLLHIVMSENYQHPVRQAGVICLKNMISSYWGEPETETIGEPVPFTIHENDKQALRQMIVEAIIHAPEAVRVQLCVCISHIIKHDFPFKFADVGNKIALYLQSTKPVEVMGALMCLHQLVKNYEFKTKEDRVQLTEPMKHLLPITFSHCSKLVADTSDMANLLQKQILKIFYALTQNNLPLDLLSRDVFTQWIQLMQQILLKPIPEISKDLDDDEKAELPCWKVKKWAAHTLSRLFERYGSPGFVTKTYSEFAEWFITKFSEINIQTMLTVVDLYRKSQFVAPRTLQQCLIYLHRAVKHAHSWKFIKPFIQPLIEEVVFPLMCHNDEDEELWNSDPVEYIRVKFDLFEDFLSPSLSAQVVLHTACSKRKGVLQDTMAFCMRIVNLPSVDPRKKDGALHILGSVADIILKRKLYKDEIEGVLIAHVFPEFHSPHGFLRAKACWVLHYFSDLRYKNESTLLHALEATKNCLCHDKDIPVRVEAAIALQGLICSQDAAQAFIKPYLKDIIVEILKVLRETENDELTSVLQKLILTYSDDIGPVALDMVQYLAQMFCQMMENEKEDNDSEDQMLAALGLLNTMETIFSVVCEDASETHKKLTPNAMILKMEEAVLPVISLVMKNSYHDLYEETLNLVYNLTISYVSPNMWQTFRLIYDLFNKDGIDYFTEMMPTLHNFVTVDAEGFLSGDHLELMFKFCEKVLTTDVGEDAECHAAKLLEVILLQHNGHVDQVIPMCIQLVLMRLTREVTTSELRTMCLQVVIAALYCSPDRLFQLISTIQLPNSSANVISHFLQQWITDIECFLGLHDRKLCVLGLCILMGMANNPEISNIATMIIPSALTLFTGLKRAYIARAQEKAEDDDDEEEEDDDDDSNAIEEDPLEDDDDAIDEDSMVYLEKLEKSTDGEEEDDDDDDDDLSDESSDETALESYETPLDLETCVVDEFITFKATLLRLESSEPHWYGRLMQELNETQMKELGEIFKLADKRKAAAESKKIEEGGGYQFQTLTVPNSFNFGSPFG